MVAATSWVIIDSHQYKFLNVSLLNGVKKGGGHTHENVNLLFEKNVCFFQSQDKDDEFYKNCF